MVRSKSAKRFEILAHTVMIFITVCIVPPFILLFMSSITSETALVRDGYSFFPKELSLDAYKFIADNAANVFRAYGITIFVTVVGTAINLAMSALLAYPLSLKNLPGKRFFSFYIFFTMLFNGGLVPTYLMYTGIFHINNTLLAYIVPGFLMSAMNVMLIRTFLQTVFQMPYLKQPRLAVQANFRFSERLSFLLENRFWLQWDCFLVLDTGMTGQMVCTM